MKLGLFEISLRSYSLREVLLLLFLFLIQFAYSQPNKRTCNWFLNKEIGIDFNTGIPVENLDDPTLSGSNIIGSVSTMSDTNGNLLFYSKGIDIVNREHEIMDGGNSVPNFNPSFQSALSMPKPGSNNLYYLFTARHHEQFNPMFYYLINMNANNGLGEIIDIDTIEAGWDASSFLTASYMKNKRDYWLITRKFEENKYAAFRVTSQGIDPNPVLSDTYQWYFDGYRGYMKISYNKKYISTSFTEAVEICKLNNETGEIEFMYFFSLSNLIPGNPAFGTTNCEFSPSSDYLYVSGTKENGGGSFIYQFDMQYIEDKDMFMQSIIEIGNPVGYNIQLAPDGKIYCFYSGENGLPINDSIVGVINYPDKMGLDCGYEIDAFTLQEGKPFRPFVNFAPDFLYRFDFEGTCESDTFTFDPWFFPEPTTIHWNFGDPASGVNNESWIPHATHKFTDGGNYEVSVRVLYPNGRIEETSREVEVSFSPEPNLGSDTTICSDSEIILDADCGPHGYSWSTGEWGVSHITVSDSGWYWVRAVNSEGCFETDSIHIALHPAATADTNNLVISPTTCGGSVGAIRGIAVSGNQPLQYQWVDDIGDSITNTIDIYHLPVGNYTLQVIDGNGCLTEFGPYLIDDAGEVLIEDVVFSHEHCDQQNGSIIVTATSGLGDMLKYSITNGEPYFYNEGIFTGLSPGTYAVRVKDSTDCEDVYTFNPIIIENIEGPQVTGVQITPATIGQNNGSLNIIASGSGDTIFYSIDDSLSFQINNGSFTNLFAGFYNCVVVDEFGCDTTFVVEVTEEVTLHLEAIAGADEVCPGNSAFVPITVSNFNDVASFSTTLIYNEQLLTCSGFTNAHPQLADSLEILLYPAEGKIILTWASAPVTLPANTSFVELKFQSVDPGYSIVDWNGSTGTSLFLNSSGLSIPVEYSPGNITIYKDVVFFFWEEIGGVCRGDTLSISPLVFSSNGDVTYLWTLPDGSTNSNQNLYINNIQPYQSGEYKITISDTVNCNASDSVIVTVFPTPVPAFAVQDTIFANDPFDLDAGSGFMHYWWNTGDTTQFVWVENQGWYSAIVESAEGCIGQDSSFVVFSSPPELIKMYFPNAFTPNGDGLNDEFTVVTNWNDYIHTFSMEIYNRWGGLVFKSNNLSQAWNGKCKGEACPAGTYIFKIVYNSTAGTSLAAETKMGTVTLVR